MCYGGELSFTFPCLGMTAFENYYHVDGSKNPYLDFSSNSDINGLRFLYRRKRGFFELTSLCCGT